MKRLTIFFTLALLLVACGEKLERRVETTFPGGSPHDVRYYDKSGSCVKEEEYYESGQLKMVGVLQDGHREGEWKSYFEDGKVQSTAFFKNGLRYGPATVFYPTGQLFQEGYYDNGKRCGVWKFYDEQGYLVDSVDIGGMPDTMPNLE